LAADIFAHLDRLDFVEVIAEDWLHRPRALRTLAAQLPITLHGVSLGLASAAPVSTTALQAMARLVEQVRPLSWSGHLPVLRAGDVEIGHLTAPPRNDETLAGTRRNLEAARRIVGAAPLVENVATLIEPPGSDRGEAAWLRAVVEQTGADLLLDL